MRELILAARSRFDAESGVSPNPSELSGVRVRRDSVVGARVTSSPGLRGADLPVERPVIAVDVTRALGQVLMTEFVLPFELLAVLLLVGLLGALYFARPEE